MDRDRRVLDLIERDGALLEGHFVLTSGLHSSRYLQCALLLQNPEHAEIIGRMLAEDLNRAGIHCDLVISPALGGIIIGHEVARALGVRAIFAERSEGAMQLRRGFSLAPGERAVVVEDVVTTGGSTLEVIELVRQKGGRPQAAACIVDRSRPGVRFDLPYFYLLRMELPFYEPANCPLCLKGAPLSKPGSRPSR